MMTLDITVTDLKGFFACHWKPSGVVDEWAMSSG